MIKNPDAQYNRIANPIEQRPMPIKQEPMPKAREMGIGLGW